VQLFCHIVPLSGQAQPPQRLRGSAVRSLRPDDTVDCIGARHPAKAVLWICCSPICPLLSMTALDHARQDSLLSILFLWNVYAVSTN